MDQIQTKTQSLEPNETDGGSGIPKHLTRFSSINILSQHSTQNLKLKLEA